MNQHCDSKGFPLFVSHETSHFAAQNLHIVTCEIQRYKKICLVLHNVDFECVFHILYFLRCLFSGLPPSLPASLCPFLPSCDISVLNLTHKSPISLVWNLDLNEPHQVHRWSVQTFSPY